jgi:hypothetical protein
MASIRFSEAEVAEALRDFAVKQGYIFDDVMGQVVGVGRLDAGSGSKAYQLVITADGTSEPLIKEDEG